MKDNNYSQLIEVSSEYVTLPNDPLLQPPLVHSSPYGSVPAYGGYQSQQPGPFSPSTVHQLIPIGQDHHHLLEVNGDHHHHKSTSHRPIVLITILQLLGLLLSLALLAAAIFGLLKSYKQYKDAPKIIRDYYLFQLVGSIIQTLNSAHGTFSFLFRSVKCLEIYGRTSTGTLLWQLVQTVAFIAYSVNSKQTPPTLAIVGIVVGWLPLIIGIIARYLRYHLITWNMLTLFTFLDNWLVEETKPLHPHCTPHKIEIINHGSCNVCYVCCFCCCCCPQGNRSYYFCPNCGEEWIRT